MKISKILPINFSIGGSVTSKSLTGNRLSINDKTCVSFVFGINNLIKSKPINIYPIQMSVKNKSNQIRKSIAKKGRDKYHKYFNSNLVSEFIVNKTLDINNNKNKYLWHRP